MRFDCGLKIGFSIFYLFSYDNNRKSEEKRKRWRETIFWWMSIFLWKKEIRVCRTELSLAGTGRGCRASDIFRYFVRVTCHCLACCFSCLRMCMQYLDMRHTYMDTYSATICLHLCNYSTYFSFYTRTHLPPTHTSYKHRQTHTNKHAHARARMRKISPYVYVSLYRYESEK